MYIFSYRRKSQFSVKLTIFCQITDTLLSTKIYRQDAVNTRTHAPVKASTKLYLEKKKSIETKKNTVAYKLVWEEMDNF